VIPSRTRADKAYAARSFGINHQHLFVFDGVCYVDGMELSAADILGPGGRIAARLANYEQRPQQLEMAEAVARAIAAKRHLVAEAGTGVGKSFAYLVPAILATTEREAVAAGGPPAGSTGGPP